MRSRNLRIITALSFAVVAHAQSSDTTGAFRGRVNNAKGGALAGANVQIRNVDTGSTRSAQVGADGTFSMGLLQVGTYKVTVKAPGMKMVEDQIRVSLGEAASRTYRMDEELAAATVEIIATAQTLDVAQVNTVSTIDEKLVSSIPLVSRNFMDLVRLTPGAVAGPGNPPRMMVGGARQIMNNLQIDGATNNSSFFGEQRGGAIIPFVFGADTIRELQVITNGFDVQYGNAAGAVINAITKSGTNDFGGSVMHLVRNDSWMAKAKATPFTPANSTQNTPAALTRSGNSTNTNLTVGGPILKDKLFYFVGVETYKTQRGAKPAWNTSGATAAQLTEIGNFASSALMNVFTRAGVTLAQEMGNPSTGTPGPEYTQETKNTSYLARLDYNLNESHRFALRVNYNKFEDTIGGGNSILTPQSNLLLNTTNAISWVLEANSIWTPELFSETRLQVSNERRPFAGNGTSPALSFPSVSIGTKTSTPRQMNEIMTELIHNTTWVRGDWSVKAGFDLQKTSIGNQFFNNGNGSFIFGSGPAAYGTAYRWVTGTLGTLSATPPTPPNTLANAADTALTYNGATSVNGGRVDIDQDLNSVYVQGQYQGLLDKRLTLIAGLRYAQQKLSDNPLPNPNFKGLDSAANSSHIDPRMAFSLDLDGKGKTILRGGYGWFSTPTPLLLVANTMTGNGQNITNYSFQLSAATLGAWMPATAPNNSGATAGLLSAAALLNGQVLGRVSDASLLALSGGGGASINTQLWDPETKMSRAKKVHLALEHDLGNGLTVGVKATYTRFEGLQYLQNINLNQGGAATPTPYNDGYANPSLNSFTRTNRPNTATVRGVNLDFRGSALAPGNPAGGFADVYLVKGDGFGRYRGLSFELSKRFSENAGFTTNLTFSKSEDTNSNERGTYTSTGGVLSELVLASTSNPAKPSSDFGPSYADRFIVLNLAGYFPIAYGVKGSFRFNYATGLPYTALVGNDPNNDGIRNEAAFGTRNEQRQPDTRAMDLRLSREFIIWRKVSIEGAIDVFNVFNWSNQEVRDTEQVATTSAGALNPNFQKIAGRDFNTREVQFGVRVKF
ncbi:MAG: TonB-dependent receptor [Acidobacteria bacterium]|nr:TonB-dependent receptor [Acidobacteriota bacterium]